MGLKAGSPQNAFSASGGREINGIYIEKVGKRSGWRLIVEPA